MPSLTYEGWFLIDLQIFSSVISKHVCTEIEVLGNAHHVQTAVLGGTQV